MKIFLSKTLFIDVCDYYNYTLKRIVTITGESNRGRQAKQENIGKAREESHGHFSKFEHALNKAIRMQLADKDSERTKDALKILDKMHSMLNTAKELDLKIAGGK